MHTLKASRRRWSANHLIVGVVQILAGIGTGAAAGYLGLLIGGRFFAGDPAGFGDIVAQIGGILFGYPIGTAIGVWLSGRALRHNGAFWASLLGAALGVGLVLLGARLFNSGALVLGWLFIFAFGLGGAMLGFHWSAQRRRH